MQTLFIGEIGKCPTLFDTQTNQLKYKKEGGQEIALLPPMAKYHQCMK
jgi:hypothetical protein